jgi:hypothetical protein
MPHSPTSSPTPSTTPGQQVVGHSGAEQVVQEGVATTHRLEEAGSHSVAHGSTEGVIVQPGYLSEHRVRDRLRGDRSPAHDDSGVLREGVQPADEQVGQGPRHRVVERLGRARPPRKGVYVERVAPGATRDRVGVPRIDLPALGPRQVLRHLTLVERLEVDTHHLG